MIQMVTVNYAVEALEQLTFNTLQFILLDIRKLTLNFSHSERNKIENTCVLNIIVLGLEVLPVFMALVTVELPNERPYSLQAVRRLGDCLEELHVHFKDLRFFHFLTRLLPCQHFAFTKGVLNLWEKRKSNL